MAISNIHELLKNMEPTLLKETYFFGTVDESYLFSISAYAQYIIDVFREEEGVSIVFLEDIKEIVEKISTKPILGPFSMITLKINSDMHEAGFLKEITNALAEQKISVNAFSAYHHDHLFVPEDKKEEALSILHSLGK